MLKRVLQIASLFALAALLVGAPELYEAVSAPYRVGAEPRALLRVALCAGEEQASAFYKALEDFRKSRPAAHLRVQRVDAQSLFSLPEPPPDVFVFMEENAPPEENFARLFAPLSASSSGGEDGAAYVFRVRRAGCGGLLCAVSSRAREAAEAQNLVRFLGEE